MFACAQRCPRRATTSRGLERKRALGLAGRLVLTPNAEMRTYAVQGRASYGRLLEGISL